MQLTAYITQSPELISNVPFTLSRIRTGDGKPLLDDPVDGYIDQLPTSDGHGRISLGNPVSARETTSPPVSTACVLTLNRGTRAVHLSFRA
jgi:hypothetical protein